nr:MAG TPA: zinc finger protein [Caudoviricetes sp.]
MPKQIENRMVIDAEFPNKEREYVSCSRCGSQIYRDDDMNYGDDCYEIDGEYYCDDCIADAARDIFRVSI